MIKSPASVLREFLIAKGDGVLPPATLWPIFVSFMPTTPNEAIVLTDTVGIDDGRLQATGERVEHPAVQVRVRARAHDDAFARIDQIKKSLDGLRQEAIILDGEVYIIHNVTRTGPPLSLGQEPGSTRHFYSLNTLITVTKE